MAFDLDNLGGHLAEVLLKTRTITDPWGWGITAEITSSGSPEWRQYELDMAADTPGSAKVRRIAAERAAESFEVAGFRKTKALTAGEKKKKLVDQLSEKGELVLDLFDLRKKKEGIARIIITKMGGLTKGGQPVDLSTPEARLAVMEHGQYEFTEGGELKQHTIPVHQRDAAGNVLLDSAGEPLENPYGGMNIGDALAQWPLDEAGETALFVEKRRADALEVSGSGSTGSIAIGFPEAPPHAES